MPLIDLGADSYPSFVDVDFADAYLAADVVRAAGWALRDDQAKPRGLISATRMLVLMPWAVEPAPNPNDPAVDIPLALQQATAMLAADLLAKPRLFSDASGNSNVKVARAGSASVEFFRPVVGGKPIPTAIWDLLVSAGLVGGADEGENAAPFISGICAGPRPLGGRRPSDWSCAEQDYD